MEHIKIEQNSNVEVVDNNIIHKLAEEAQDCDASSNMTGNLQTDKAFRSDVSYLTTKFPGLTINVTGDYYIDFADDEVARIMNSNYGDGTGVTEDAAKVPDNFAELFKENTQITSFDELRYFTNKTKINNTTQYYNNGGEFYGCSNLETIDLTNINWIEGQFMGCSKLKTVKNFNGKIISKYTGTGNEFDGCAALETINLSNVAILGSNVFSDCTALANIGNLNNLVVVFGGAFNETPSLAIDVNCPYLCDVSQLPPNDVLRSSDATDLLNYGLPSIFHYSGIVSISNLGKTAKLKDGENYNNYITHKYNVGFASHCTNLRFVILPDTLTYIGTYAFWGDTAMEYVKVLASTPPTLGENDPTNNAHPFYNCTCKFYVPDGTLAAYQAASGWDALCQAGRVFEMSQFATDFPND